MSNNNKLMSHEEKDRLFKLAWKLEAEGKEEEAINVSKQIPLAPYLAKGAKEVFGADFLLNSGFNLAEAEEEYGKDWLTS